MFAERLNTKKLVVLIVVLVFLEQTFKCSARGGVGLYLREKVRFEVFGADDLGLVM